MPPKKQIITIFGVLGVVAFGLGYWYGGLSDKWDRKSEWRLLGGIIMGVCWLVLVLKILKDPVKITRYPKLLSIGLSCVLSFGIIYIVTWTFLLLNGLAFEPEHRSAEFTTAMFKSYMLKLSLWASGIVYVAFFVLQSISFVVDKLKKNLGKYVRSSKTKCKWCKETIKADALICKHCGVRFEERETALIAPRESP